MMGDHYLSKNGGWAPVDVAFVQHQPHNKYEAFGMFATNRLPRTVPMARWTRD
jgi:hypothetical protein